MTSSLNIALAQINPTVGSLEHNSNKILEFWQRADENAADLVVFPELAICGYPPEDLVLKPSFIEGCHAAIKTLAAQSKSLKSAALIGVPITRDGQNYNAVYLIERGEIKTTSLKHNLPNYGVFDEQRIFKEGPLPVPIEFRGTKLGILICEDMWFPEAAAHLKENGAEILIVPNASPFESDKEDMRMNFAKDRVRETGLPLFYVNQVGGQDELVFDGGSFVLTADGKIMLEASHFDEHILHCHCAEMQSTKQSSQNGLPRSLQSLAMTKERKIYSALTLGLKDYIEKNNFPGVLIGLSGGIDSALSAVIAADAIGADKVHCVMMPSQFTSQDSLDDAAALADNLGVRLDSISIEQPVAAFNDILGDHFSDDTPATTFENIQPRSRGLILMALSNATGKMVLSTGNKSEMAVGYATLYGDMCGGFNALKDLYKTQVYALSRWRNQGGEVIPERIITKAPTAELKDNQTDQDTLPEYEELDAILHCLIEEDLSLEDIVGRGHERDTVARIWTMLDRAEYKRRQAPPGIKITSRAFGRDRRYPITNHFVSLTDT